MVRVPRSLTVMLAFFLAMGGSRVMAAAEGGNDDEELRVFDADMGPASIDVSTYPPEYQNLYPLFAQKCSKCHTLARPINSSMQGDEWFAYVSRMSRKPGSGISPQTADKIYTFLAYDSQTRARSSDAIDPEMLPFLNVSKELSGVARFPAAHKNVPVDVDEIRIKVRGDRRLDLKQFFALDGGQQLVRWSRRRPDQGELVLHPIEALDGGPDAADGQGPVDAGVALAAAEAVEDETDPVEKVELILDWLDESIERVSEPGLGSSAGALAERRGDATEFTLLFRDMARAAGLEARTQVGLVARRTSFHFSAWADVWVGRWVPVDPYLGQFPADITHVRIASQAKDELTEWDPDRYPALDRLAFKVVEEEDGTSANGGEANE